MPSAEAPAPARAADPARRTDVASPRLPRGVVALIAVFLTIQLVVPAVVLVRSRAHLLVTKPAAEQGSAARLGWHMYAESSLAKTYTVVRTDGSTGQLDPTAVVGQLRGRALYDPSTFAAVCRADRTIAVLQWQGQVHRCA